MPRLKYAHGYDPVFSSVICFGVFDADVRTGELRKNGVRIKIQELPFRALKLLLSRPNHVFTREEFRQTLWHDGVFVDFDHGISSAINRLRDALGDSASNKMTTAGVSTDIHDFNNATDASCVNNAGPPVNMLQVADGTFYRVNPAYGLPCQLLKEISHILRDTALRRLPH